MRRASSPSLASSESCSKKMSVSRWEVETLIRQEVHSVMKKSEEKLDRLIEQVEEELKCQSDISKLQAHINTLKRRGDAAIAHIAKFHAQSPAEPLPVTCGSSRSEVKVLNEVGSNHTKSAGLFQLMEETKEGMKAMQALSEAPSVQTLLDGVEEKTPASPQGADGAEEEEEEEEEEPASPSNRTNHQDAEQEEELPYPPLPSISVPSTLNTEAASYNLPQRPRTQLGLIRNPPGLSLLWDSEQEDPAPPPMDSYMLYMSMEKVKGSGVFSEWKDLGEVKAIPLPMCVLITKYKPGHKVCFTVVGKDKFGRSGPYSNVVMGTVPD
ncbi:activating transcription factor 7 interacting protein 2 [Genypterus blacodes]|uniref:activating transcription factor 7 interacting protein 2 n=1 Tax=Genypterus blacodes TaxID=154954 RepID=UPI003F7735DF